MNTFRTLTAVGAVALAAAVLTPATAHAGGYPSASVTIDRQAYLTADTVTLSGTYSCVSDDPATLYTEVSTRSSVGSGGSTGITCDGSTHTWTTTGPREGVRRGTATALVTFELVDASGAATWEFFHDRVTVVPRG